MVRINTNKLKSPEEIFAAKLATATIGDISEEELKNILETSEIQRKRRTEIRKMFQNLSEEETSVIVLRFGLDYGGERSLDKIAQIIHKPLEWVKAKYDELVNYMKTNFRINSKEEIVSLAEIGLSN